MTRIAAEALRAFGTALYRKKGLRAADARFIAEAAVATQAGGVATHGIVSFVRLDRHPDGVTDPRTQPRVVRERGAMAVIDCEGCYSQLGLRRAQHLGTRKARQHGVAMIALRNGSWAGGLGAFVLPLVRRGLIVQAWGQYSSCQDGAPPGGIDARLSTNPVCLGWPGPAGPVLADFSTTVLSMGKAMRLAREGRRASERCFYDRRGRRTDDPSVLKQGGAMQLMGGDLNGYKGFAFSLWAEALAAMAGGRTNNPDSPRRQYLNLLMVYPAAFGAPSHFRREMEHLAAWIKSSRQRAGSDPVRLPGERFLARMAAAEQDGVEVDDTLLQSLHELAAKYGLPRLGPITE